MGALKLGSRKVTSKLVGRGTFLPGAHPGAIFNPFAKVGKNSVKSNLSTGYQRLN